MTSPVYIQIHNKIKRAIESRKWEIGERLPSERSLAMEFKVSRMTLRQAIQTLVDEGILKRVTGSGTYVAHHKIQEPMSGITSFTDIMLSQGKVPSNHTVSYHVVEPSLSEREKLKIKQNEKVLRMERIRYGDKIPICFEVVTIPEKIIKGLSKEDITRSLYSALEEQKFFVPDQVQQTISAMLASEKIAEYLEVKRGAPILRLHQLTYLKDKRPFEYVRAQYVGDRFEFYLKR